MAQVEHVTTAIPALITGATAKTPTSGTGQRTPSSWRAWPTIRRRPIPLFPIATDFEERADHLDKVLKALTLYLAELLDERRRTSQASVAISRRRCLISRLPSPAPSSRLPRTTPST